MRIKTKIICTIGPASNTETVLRKMMLAGMDVVRLNFSHGSHLTHRKVIELIRRINKKYRRRIKIMQDLEGFRIRIGRLCGKRPILLEKGQIVFLDTNIRINEKNIIPFDYKGTLDSLASGQMIFIDDGLIALKIKRLINKNRLKAVVVISGCLSEHKGINIPEAKLKFAGLSKKDQEDILFGMEQGVDYVAQSFVRGKRDVKTIRSILERENSNCHLIAKIETREGIKNIDDIIDQADGIMVARGDMGVSIPIQEVPLIQKMIIKKCNKEEKIAITATQMLESMVHNHRPTRAEVSDVANAILDGADFMMLSAETAIGEYPVESVKMMNNTIKCIERSPLYTRKNINI